MAKVMAKVRQSAQQLRRSEVLSPCFALNRLNLVRSVLPRTRTLGMATPQYYDSRLVHSLKDIFIVLTAQLLTPADS